MAQYKSRGSEIGPRAIYRARALAALGLNPADPMVGEFFDDFITASAGSSIYNWTSGVAGSGTVNAQTAGTGGGHVTLQTGATGSSAQDLNGMVGAVANVSTGKGYAAARFSVATAVDNQAIGVIGWLNQVNNKSICVGFNGTLNAGNFVLQDDGFHSGVGTDLGLAFDTNKHIFEVFFRGDGKAYGQVDGLAVVSHTMAAAPADYVKHYLSARNGTTATNRSIIVDWYYSMFVRT
jgi:hypothetical protein